LRSSSCENALVRARSKALRLRVSVREQACNDPNCAPIDTIVEFLFRSELRGMVGLPCEVGEVREATIDEVRAALEAAETEGARESG